MTVVITPTLDNAPSLTLDLQQHIADFRNQTADQTTIKLLHLDPPVVVFIYTHNRMIYAQQAHDPFTPGYPAEQARLFALQLLTQPDQQEYDRQTEPHIYLSETAALIVAKVDAHTHDISDEHIADIMLAADQHGASPHQHHAILSAFAPTPRLFEAQQQHAASVPRYTPNQVQSIVAAAHQAGVTPTDISYLVKAADHEPNDYNLPFTRLNTTGLMSVIQKAKRAGFHIDTAALIAATILDDPNDVLTILDICGYQTTRYTPP